MDASKFAKCFKSAEDRKQDLIIQKQFAQDEYDACVAATGDPNDPQCLLLLSILQQICAELELVCSLISNLTLMRAMSA